MTRTSADRSTTEVGCSADNELKAVVSLFTGGGGLDIGLEDAGFTTVAAVESVPTYCDTLRTNKWLSTATELQFEAFFNSVAPSLGRLDQRQLKLTRGRWTEGLGRRNAVTQAAIYEVDVRDLDPQVVMDGAGLKRGEVALLVGGPPCQTFSKSGKREGFEDPRGLLFLDFVRFLEALRPRWFLFENVKGLTNKPSFVVECSCQACGPFIPTYDQLVGHETSVGGYRCPRCGSTGTKVTRSGETKSGTLDIVLNELQSCGYSCDVTVLNAVDFGAPQYRERLFILGSRDGEPLNDLHPTHAAQRLDQLALPMTDSPSETLLHRSVWEALFTESNPYHDWPLDPANAVLWVKNIVRPRDEAVTFSLSRPSPTVGAHQGAKLAIAPYGVPEEQLARQQWHTLGRRQGDTKPVPVRHSYLSDEDLLRLQTFPRSWALSGTRMERAFQIGNAVPPSLAAAVARRFRV